MNDLKTIQKKTIAQAIRLSEVKNRDDSISNEQFYTAWRIGMDWKMIPRRFDDMIWTAASKRKRVVQREEEVLLELG